VQKSETESKTVKLKMIDSSDKILSWNKQNGGQKLDED